MTRVSLLGEHYRDLSEACDISLMKLDKKDRKRDRHGGKAKFRYGQSQKRQRRHLNKRLANQEYRRYKFDW